MNGYAYGKNELFWHKLKQKQFTGMFSNLI